MSAFHERIELPAHEAHLWLLFPSRAASAARLDTYRAWLSADERARAARFTSPDGARDYVLTRGLVRETLSRYTDITPGDWSFGVNSWGRPHVVGHAEAPRFNVSHTRGLIAVLVAHAREIGVDAEDTARPGETVGVAERFFAASEVRALNALPEHERRARFFAYWTLKEAYIKARGMGLAIPLEQFAFALHEGRGEIAIAIDPALGDDADSWQFDRFAPSETHVLATAVRRARGEPRIALVVRDLDADAPAPVEDGP